MRTIDSQESPENSYLEDEESFDADEGPVDLGVVFHETVGRVGTNKRKKKEKRKKKDKIKKTGNKKSKSQNESKTKKNKIKSKKK